MIIPPFSSESLGGANVNSPQENVHLTDLPNEVLQKVLLLLNDKDKMHMGATSRTLRANILHLVNREQRTLLRNFELFLLSHVAEPQRSKVQEAFNQSLQTSAAKVNDVLTSEQKANFTEEFYSDKSLLDIKNLNLILRDKLIEILNTLEDDKFDPLMKILRLVNMPAFFEKFYDLTCHFCEVKKLDVLVFQEVESSLISYKADNIIYSLSTLSTVINPFEIPGTLEQVRKISAKYPLSNSMYLRLAKMFAEKELAKGHDVTESLNIIKKISDEELRESSLGELHNCLIRYGKTEEANDLLNKISNKNIRSNIHFENLKKAILTKDQKDDDFAEELSMVDTVVSPDHLGNENTLLEIIATSIAKRNLAKYGVVGDLSMVTRRISDQKIVDKIFVSISMLAARNKNFSLAQKIVASIKDKCFRDYSLSTLALEIAANNLDGNENIDEAIKIIQQLPKYDSSRTLIRLAKMIAENNLAKGRNPIENNRAFQLSDQEAKNAILENIVLFIYRNPSDNGKNLFDALKIINEFSEQNLVDMCLTEIIPLLAAFHLNKSGEISEALLLLQQISDPTQKAITLSKIAKLIVKNELLMGLSVTNALNLADQITDQFIKNKTLSEIAKSLGEKIYSNGGDFAPALEIAGKITDSSAQHFTNDYITTLREKRRVNSYA